MCHFIGAEVLVVNPKLFNFVVMINGWRCKIISEFADDGKSGEVVNSEDDRQQWQRLISVHWYTRRK